MMKTIIVIIHCDFLMFLKVNEVEIYYEIHGTGFPLLFLHGWILDHNVLKIPIESFLHTSSVKDEFQRIYVDLPGMGKSASQGKIASSDDIFHIIQIFVNNVIGTKHFAIIGESYGGYLARAIASVYLAQIKGLFFLCPVIEPKSSKRRIPKFEVITKSPQMDRIFQNVESSDFEELAVVQTQKTWDKYQSEVQSGINKAELTLLDSIQQSKYAFSFNPDERIGIFNNPCTFLVGKQDNVVGYEDAWKLCQEYYPRASFFVADEAGHNLQIEKESLFQTTFQDWVKRISVDHQ